MLTASWAPCRQLVAEWPLPLLPRLVIGLHALLETPPVIERRYCEDFEALQLAAKPRPSPSFASSRRGI